MNNLDEYPKCYLLIQYAPDGFRYLYCTNTERRALDNAKRLGKKYPNCKFFVKTLYIMDDLGGDHLGGFDDDELIVINPLGLRSILTVDDLRRILNTFVDSDFVKGDCTYCEIDVDGFVEHFENGKVYFRMTSRVIVKNVSSCEECPYYEISEHEDYGVYYTMCDLFDIQIKSKDYYQSKALFTMCQLPTEKEEVE